jgi:hypothetical protein
MLRVEVSHTFPVSVSDAFAYITDLKNWPEYWPEFIRIENPSEAKFANPGDKVTVVIRLLNREYDMHIEVQEFEKDARVRYISRHHGQPDAHHERQFRAVGAGCEFRAVIAYEPRRGLAGLFDRVVVKRSVAGAGRKTVQNLDKVFQQRTAGA